MIAQYEHSNEFMGAGLISNIIDRIGLNEMKKARKVVAEERIRDSKSKHKHYAIDKLIVPVVV